MTQDPRAQRTRMPQSPFGTTRAKLAATLAIVAVAIGAAAAAAALWNQGDVAPTVAEPATTVTAKAQITRDAVAPEQSGPQTFTVLTTAVDSLRVADAPGGSTIETLARWTALGADTTLLAVDTGTADGEDWFQVQLPARAGHEMGWVRASDVTAATTERRVDIFLAEHELVVSDGEEVLLTTTVAVGAAESPTPLGTFYVTDPLDFSHNPSGVYGAYAIGLSGYSETLDSFDGGVPQIAMHGTNQPDLLGQNVSNGCIRMENDAVLRLAADVALGTPVIVHASRADA